MKTIFDIELSQDDLDNGNYNYQPILTKELDSLNIDFDQDIINNIILWKVNRYAKIDNEALLLINRINREDNELNIELTTKILLKLLDKKQRGIRLPMASTILRFKNPKIYQILDQRVYRFIYPKKTLKYSSNLNNQINLYIQYLTDLKTICIERKIDYSISDRILYSLDKFHNKNEKLENY